MVVDPVVYGIDERWTVVHSTALRDHSDRYIDPTSDVGIVAHPLFPVCTEWQTIGASTGHCTWHGAVNCRVG